MLKERKNIVKQQVVFHVNQ